MYYVSKILKIGGSFAAIIPARLARSKFLQKGDLIIITEKGETLELRAMNDIIDNASKIDKGGHNVIDR